MFTAKDLLENQRCTYRPDNSKRCGHRHGETIGQITVSLSYVVVQGEFKPEIMGAICSICLPSFLTNNKGDTALIPITDVASMFEKNDVTSQTTTVSGGPEKPERGPRPERKPNRDGKDNRERRGHGRNNRDRRDRRDNKPKSDRSKESKDAKSPISQGKFPVVATALTEALAVPTTKPDAPTKPGEMPKNFGMKHHYLVEKFGLAPEIFDAARMRSWAAKTPVLDEVAKMDEGQAAIGRAKASRDAQSRIGAAETEAETTATDDPTAASATEESAPVEAVA